MIPDYALARTRIWHQRYQPFHHRFGYPMELVWCRLGSEEAMLEQHWGWGRRWRPMVFRSRDFVSRSTVPLLAKVQELARSHELDWSDGRIYMLAQWRSLGTLFNPLVLYFFFPEGASKPSSMIAEVQNTPWRERHFYALPLQSDANGELTVDHEKAFHVSPFLPMLAHYYWRLHVALPEVTLMLEEREAGTPTFKAGMTVTLEPATRRQMTVALFRAGAQGWKTLARIHWQALRLWRKGARFYPHPGRVKAEQKHGQ